MRKNSRSCGNEPAPLEGQRKGSCLRKLRRGWRRERPWESLAVSEVNPEPGSQACATPRRGAPALRPDGRVTLHAASAPGCPGPCCSRHQSLTQEATPRTWRRSSHATRHHSDLQPVCQPGSSWKPDQSTPSSRLPPVTPGPEQASAEVTLRAYGDALLHEALALPSSRPQASALHRHSLPPPGAQACPASPAASSADQCYAVHTEQL